MNKGIDDKHGGRAAELAAAFRGEYFTLSNEEFDLLHEACARHTDGGITEDVTIATCWDSDRLDLGRVGICPAPQKLSTDAAKHPEILKWADGRACLQIAPKLVKQDWKIDIADGNHK